MNTKRIIAFLMLIVFASSLILPGCSAKRTDDAQNTTDQNTDITYPSGTENPQTPEKLERTKYNMDITLHEDAQPYIDMTVQVGILNDSEDTWKEVCFRDFMVPVLNAVNEEDTRVNYDSPHASDALAENQPENADALESGIKAAYQSGNTINIRPDGDDKSVLFAALNTPLAPGESTYLTLEYRADIPNAYLRCSYLDYKNGKRLYELAQFYPMLCVYENGEWVYGEYLFMAECMYSKCADYDITLRLPEKYDVIASGDEARSESTDGISTWKIDADNMRDVTVMVSDAYDMLSGEAQGIKINSYFIDRHQGELALQAAIDSIEAFTAAYGKYPYDELDVLESNLAVGSMESPGLVRIHKFDDSNVDHVCGYTVAHEIAHIYFYGAVGNDQFNEPWLDESFAAYSQLVYDRYVGRPEEEIKSEMEFYLVLTRDSGPVTLDLPCKECTLYGYVLEIYNFGAAFLYQLEQSMGESTFFDFMKEYYRTYSYKVVHTDDFLNCIAPYVENNESAKELLKTHLKSAKDMF